MKKILIILLLSSVLFAGCGKDDEPAPPATIDKYMSLTAGSTWNYEIVDSVQLTTTPYTFASTSTDTTIGSKIYHVFTNSNGSGNEYYNVTGNEYFNFRSLPSALGGSNVENIYLKDNLAVGANWSQTYTVTVSGFPTNVIATNTIAEKGISKVVKNITYTNVIRVTTTLAVSISGIPLPASALSTDIQTFYAPKVGMIQSHNKIDLDFNGMVDHSNDLTSLISADIK